MLDVLTPVASPQVRRLRLRFIAALVVQLALIVAVPLPKVAAYAWGTPVLLEIRPVDPYDILRGRYMRVDYALASEAALAALPGWQAPWGSPGTVVFVTLRPGAAGAPWTPVAVASEAPEELPAGHVLLRGRMENGSLALGLGEFHMPEERGDEAEAALRRAPESARAEVRVDGEGRAVLVGLWLDGKRY